MKFTPIFALLAASAPIIAQAQTADVPAVAASGAPIPLASKTAATADGFVWRFAPPVGSRWTMRSFKRTTLTNQGSVTQENKPIRALLTTYTNKFTADYDVLSRDALGATTIRLTIRLTIREATQDVTFTNQGKTTRMRVPKSADSRSLNGATLTIKQGPDGKVWNFVGMRAFVRRTMEADGDLDTETIDDFLNIATAAKMKDIEQSLSVRTGTLPLSPIRVGESWSITEYPPVQSLISTSTEITGTRTLKSLDADFAVIVDNARLAKGDSRRKLTATIPVIDSKSLTLQVNGTTRVQRSSGLPLEAALTQIIKGNYSAKAFNSARPSPYETTTTMRAVLEPR